MSGKFLLDTNIIIAIFAKEQSVEDRIKGQDIFLPSTAIGELYYGAYKSGRIAANVARVDELAAHNSVLICDTQTARHYGQIREQLRAKGRPIPDNDIWIAALALQHNLTLATRDGHFKEVEGLLLELW